MEQYEENQVRGLGFGLWGIQLIKINSNSAEKVLDAFVLVSDPIYNGHTTKLNKIIDDLPEKKTKT